MKINPIGPNQTEVHTARGAVVFFSYRTPVAARMPDGSFVRTSRKWSVTTSKHINRWLGDVKATEVPQENLDKMA